MSPPGHSTSLRDYRGQNWCCPQTDYKQTREQAVTTLAKHAEAPPLPTYLLVEKEWDGSAGNLSMGREAEHPKPEELGQGRSRAEAEDQDLC